MIKDKGGSLVLASDINLSRTAQMHKCIFTQLHKCTIHTHSFSSLGTYLGRQSTKVPSLSHAISHFRHLDIRHLNFIVHFASVSTIFTCSFFNYHAFKLVLVQSMVIEQ